MKYKTIVSYQKENHPWPPFVPKNANKIIFGTFPTAIRNRGKIDFYYPNPNNQFWNVLRAVKEGAVDINKTVVLDLDGRKRLLKVLGLGIADLGYRIFRPSDSSLDGRLFVTEFTDIFGLLDNNPNVKKLIFCSSSGQNSVEAWFRYYCSLNNIKFPKIKGANPKRTHWHYGEREIEIVTVHSTSRAAAKRFNVLVEMYKNEIKS